MTQAGIPYLCTGKTLTKNTLPWFSRKMAQTCFRETIGLGKTKTRHWTMIVGGRVHPRKLTCLYFNRTYIFQPLIFMGHVSFRGCKLPETAALVYLRLKLSVINPKPLKIRRYTVTHSLPFKSSAIYMGLSHFTPFITISVVQCPCPASVFLNGFSRPKGSNEMKNMDEVRFRPKKRGRFAEPKRKNIAYTKPVF